MLKPLVADKHSTKHIQLCLMHQPYIFIEFDVEKETAPALYTPGAVNGKEALSQMAGQAIVQAIT